LADLSYEQFGDGSPKSSSVIEELFLSAARRALLLPELPEVGKRSAAGRRPYWESRIIRRVQLNRPEPTLSVPRPDFRSASKGQALSAVASAPNFVQGGPKPLATVFMPFGHERAVRLSGAQLGEFTHDRTANPKTSSLLSFETRDGNRVTY